MIDYHCHLDLYPDPLKVFEDVKTKHIDVLAVTTSPRSYLKASQYFSNAAKVRIALGFHPELISKRMNEWELFLNTIKRDKNISEKLGLMVRVTAIVLVISKLHSLIPH